MSEDSKSSKITSLFLGEYEQLISCENVPVESRKVEKTLEISVEVDAASNLTDALRRLTLPEYLRGENQYRTKEHGLQDAVKSVQYIKYPASLFIHLKRFAYNPRTDALSKVCA